MLFARIEDGRVIEVIPFDPTGRFPVEMVWVSCPAGTTQGDLYDGASATFTATPNSELIELEAYEPAEPSDPPVLPRRKQVSRTEYYGLFTPVEEALIRMTAATEVTLAAVNAASGAEKEQLMEVAALKVMLARTDALGPSNLIDLDNHQVQAGVGLLATMGLLTQERADEILEGVPE